MELTFTTDDAKMNINFEVDCTTVEIWNVDHWNVITLNDEQLTHLKKHLQKMEQMMLLTTKAKIINDQAKRDKDIEQLALGYLEDTWNAAIDEALKILEAEHEIEPQHIPARITTAMHKIRSLKK